MSEKIWNTYLMEVNGLTQEVRFSADAVENIFKPFLKKLAALHEKLNRKIVAYIAASPGVGKTTLTLFLEKLSREDKNFYPIRALGMDGFHYDSEYLKTHEIELNGEKILLNNIKGAPETFDVDSLQNKLSEVRGNGTRWNIYDRKIHDVIHDSLNVDDEIILLEGNYLLLKDSRWKNIREFADYKIFITADPEILRERLINRKVLGGIKREDAEKFYYASDSKNVERVLKNSVEPDETWQMLADSDYIKIAGKNYSA